MIAVVSCNQGVQKISKDEMLKIVESRNVKLGEYFKAGDAEKLSLMYSDSAKLCPDGSKFVNGRDSIKAFWAESFKTSKTMDMITNIYTIDGNKDIIYETGKASSKILYNDSLYNVTVKYINVWNRQSNGDYLLDVDFWNRDAR
jgi:ketosteroid isomerase-like protein